MSALSPYREKLKTGTEFCDDYSMTGITDKERVIISAYTGVLMCDFDELHKYIEERLGRPVFTHEMASEAVQAEIKEKLKPDFTALCGKSEI